MVPDERSVAELREAVATKDLLIRELHHRIKNDLQLISDLLWFETGDLSERDARSALEATRQRIRAVAQVHHTLSATSEPGGTAELSSFLQDLCSGIGSAFGAASRGFALDVDAEPVRVASDLLVPLGLVANELVTNAFKHAGPPIPPETRQTVSVRLRRAGDDAARLLVADGGAGVPDGFDLRGARGHGMRLIAGLVRHIDGHIRLGDCGRGACFVVTFPVRCPLWRPSRPASRESVYDNCRA